MALSLSSSDRYAGLAESGRRLFEGTLTLGSSFAAAGMILSPATLGSFTDPVTSLAVAPAFSRFDQVIIGAPLAYNGTTTANAIMATWDPRTQIVSAFAEDQTSGVITKTAATTDYTLSVFPILIVGA